MACGLCGCFFITRRKNLIWKPCDVGQFIRYGFDRKPNAIGRGASSPGLTPATRAERTPVNESIIYGWSRYSPWASVAAKAKRVLFIWFGRVDWFGCGNARQVQLLPTLKLPAKRVLVSVNNPNIDGRTNNQRQPSRPQIHFTNKADGQKYRFWP